MRPFRTLVFSLAALGLAAPIGGCLGGIDSGPLDGAGPRFDGVGGGGLADASVAVDVGQSDLPTRAGDPCPSGKCAGGMLCIAALCHRTCKQPLVGCNDIAKECGPMSSCLPGSSFSDACFPASATVNQACGDTAGGARCVGGTLCVNYKGVVCRKLAKYGCATGERMQKTSRGCNVCLPP